jgi:hypothetical protein
MTLYKCACRFMRHIDLRSFGSLNEQEFDNDANHIKTSDMSSSQHDSKTGSEDSLASLATGKVVAQGGMTFYHTVFI